MVAGIIITLAEQGVPGILDAIDRIFIGVFEGVGLRRSEGVVLLMCKVVLHANIKDVGSHGNCHFQTVGGDGNEVGNAKLQLRQIDLAAHVVFAHRAVGARRIKAGIFMIAVGIAQIPHTHGGGIGGGLRQAGGFHTGKILHRLRPQAIGGAAGGLGCLPHAERKGVVFLHGAEVVGHLRFAFLGQLAFVVHLTHGVVVAQHGAVQIDRLGIGELRAGIGIALPLGFPRNALSRHRGRVIITAQRDVHGGNGGGLCLVHGLAASGIAMVNIAVAQLFVAHGAAGRGGGDRRDHGRNNLRSVAAAGTCGDYKAPGQHGVIDLQHDLVILAVRTQPGGQLGDGVVSLRQGGQHIVGTGLAVLVVSILVISRDELAANWINGAVYHAVIVQVDVALDAGNGSQHGVLAGNIIRVVVIEGNIIVEILVGGDGDVLIARVGDAVDQDHIVRVQMEIDGADIFQLRADLVKAAVSAENILRQCAGLFVAEAVFPVREVPVDLSVGVGHAAVALRLLPQVVPGAFDLFGIDGGAVLLAEPGYGGCDFQRECLLTIHDHVDVALLPGAAGGHQQCQRAAAGGNVGGCLGIFAVLVLLAEEKGVIAQRPVGLSGKGIGRGVVAPGDRYLGIVIELCAVRRGAALSGDQGDHRLDGLVEAGGFGLQVIVIRRMDAHNGQSDGAAGHVAVQQIGIAVGVARSIKKAGIFYIFLVEL